MSVYITGDTHGKYDFKKIFNLYNSNKLNKDDYLIILGDFGFIWSQKPSEEEIYGLRWLEKVAPWTTLFIDGNHENFTRLLNDYPLIHFKDGKAYKINNKVYYLPRGEVYQLCGKLFLTLGGANSIDKHLRESYKSWWPEEEITEEQYINVLDTLDNFDSTKDMKINYILTHAAPDFFVSQMYNKKMLLSGLPLLTTPSEQILQSIYNKYTFDHWYCGHYHVDIEAEVEKNNTPITALFNKIIKVC